MYYSCINPSCSFGTEVPPDRIGAQSGAQAALSYVGCSGGTAAIQYHAAANHYRVVVFGFPFETITSATTRTDIMERVIGFLEDTTEPLLFDFDHDGDVDLVDYLTIHYCLEFSGPDPPGSLPQYCLDNGVDYDGDLDVDLHEFAKFQEVFTGE